VYCCIPTGTLRGPVVCSIKSRTKQRWKKHTERAMERIQPIEPK